MRELRFAGVSVRFGRRRQQVTAVDDVDLVVPAGTVVGLVGESGSGKSTLARAAVGLAPLAAGRITLDGAPVPTRGRRPLQMVFQDPYSSLDPRMTIGATIGEAVPRGADGGVHGRAARAAEVRRLLELVDLFISHDLAVVRYVSDAIAVMWRGRIVEHGVADDVLTNPEDPYTRELLTAQPTEGRSR